MPYSKPDTTQGRTTTNPKLPATKPPDGFDGVTGRPLTNSSVRPDVEDGGKIELSANQLYPGAATPEDFVITPGDDFSASVSGQTENDAISEAKCETGKWIGSNYKDAPEQP